MLFRSAALAFVDVTDPGSGQTRQAGWVLWPIFGASNQLLAALTLMVLALYFAARKRPVLPLVIPMIFVTAVALLALVAKLRDFLAQGNAPLAGLAILMLALAVWMLFEGLAALRRARAASGPPSG